MNAFDNPEEWLKDRLRSVVEEELSTAQKLAKTSLEGTLPWEVRVKFYNEQGDEVWEWRPRFVLHNWGDRLTLTFSPTDIEADIH